MSPLRLKSCNLSNIDNTSLKSMLSLARDLLSDEWILVEKGQADLCLYSLETTDSNIAWLQRGEGLTALLISTNSVVDESADIILKKPLRAKNFSDALNNSAEKIKRNNVPKKTVKTKQQSSNSTKKAVKKPSIIGSLSSSISKALTSKKAPAKDLPNLTLYLPEKSKSKPDTILDPALLKVWFSELPENDNDKIISSILANLSPLNRASIPEKTRLTLLDIYRQPISKLVFHRDTTTVKREMSSPTEFLRTVNTLNLLLEELAIGYKIIIDDAYQKGRKPQSNNYFLIALNRATEMLSLCVLNAYRYYRSAPTSSMNELHQLYLYSEKSGTLQKTVSLKAFETKTSIFQFYCQIMLTGISDPYSLEKYDVFRLYNLMGKFTDKTEISPLTHQQKQATNESLVSGNFCIDCTNDHLPSPLIKTTMEKRSLPQARILNTQGVLLAIEQIFIKSAKTSQRVYDLDIQILKKIIPHINTSYKRKHHRLPVTEPRQINLVSGVSAIQRCLHGEKSSESLEWSIIDMGAGGIMVSRDNETCPRFVISELMGIFEGELPPKLAIIRWLHINNNNTVQIGLNICSEHPIAISYIIEGETRPKRGLLITEKGNSNKAPTLILNKGVYSANRVFHLTEGTKEYTVVAKEIIKNAFNYEQFSFTIKSKKAR